VAAYVAALEVVATSQGAKGAPSTEASTSKSRTPLPLSTALQDTVSDGSVVRPAGALIAIPGGVPSEVNEAAAEELKVSP
jgi:hypothetical protein